jgi:hypothetical protein
MSVPTSRALVLFLFPGQLALERDGEEDAEILEQQLEQQ